MEDKYGKKLKKGDVIDLNQTVNGQNLFLIEGIEPLEVSYYLNGRKYEYDKQDLLAPCRYSGEVDWEILNKYRTIINSNKGLICDKTTLRNSFDKAYEEAKSELSILSKKYDSAFISKIEQL